MGGIRDVTAVITRNVISRLMRKAPAYGAPFGKLGSTCLPWITTDGLEGLFTYTGAVCNSAGSVPYHDNMLDTTVLMCGCGSCACKLPQSPRPFDRDGWWCMVSLRLHSSAVSRSPVFLAHSGPSRKPHRR